MVVAKAIGIAEKIPLPNGGYFLVVGYTDLLEVEEGFVITVAHGLNGDTSALCAALTP